MGNKITRDLVHDLSAELWLGLMTDGGTSCRPDDLKPLTGYMVAPHVSSTYVGRWDQVMVTETHLIRTFVARNLDLIRGDSTLWLGAWHDTRSGLVYLDVSRWVQDRGEALTLAECCGEIAIWDNAARCEIRVASAAMA